MQLLEDVTGVRFFNHSVLVINYHLSSMWHRFWDISVAMQSPKQLLHSSLSPGQGNFHRIEYVYPLK